MNNKITNALNEIHEIDELTELDSPVHRFSALFKLLVTIIYIGFVVSFDKYALSAMIPMILYPILMFSLSGIPVRLCLYKMRFILPLVMAVGIFNPFFDHTLLLVIGNMTVTGGWISMVTLMLKGVLSLMASFILISTTKIDDICAALRFLHIPSVLVSMFLLTYRYIFIMMDEVSVMTTAYHLRAPNQKGIAFSAWGSFLGQLLLRSMDRAERIYQGMELRGFRNEFYYSGKIRFQNTDWVFLIGFLLFFILCRFVNVSEVIGNLIMR